MAYLVTPLFNNEFCEQIERVAMAAHRVQLQPISISKIEQRPPDIALLKPSGFAMWMIPLCFGVIVRKNSRKVQSTLITPSQIFHLPWKRIKKCQPAFLDIAIIKRKKKKAETEYIVNQHIQITIEIKGLTLILARKEVSLKFSPIIFNLFVRLKVDLMSKIS